MSILPHIYGDQPEHRSIACLRIPVPNKKCNFCLKLELRRTGIGNDFRKTTGKRFDLPSHRDQNEQSADK